MAAVVVVVVGMAPTRNWCTALCLCGTRWRGLTLPQVFESKKHPIFADGMDDETRALAKPFLTIRKLV